MPEERKLPRTPPRHPSTGPMPPDTMPEQPRPPIAPSPEQRKELEEQGSKKSR
jgi:hypothetical protein